MSKENNDLFYNSLKDIVRIQQRMAVLAGFLSEVPLPVMSKDLFTMGMELDDACVKAQQAYEQK